MRELKLSELTTEEKVGMAMIGYVSSLDEQFDYCIELIKSHRLGGIYINPTDSKLKERMARIKEAADYPILIMCDPEDGIDGSFIGALNALGMTANEELAYTFGKVVSVKARKLGYNIIGCPVLDMVNFNCTCGGTSRSLGGNKYKVAALAESVVRGIHDGGVLSVGKHYPGTAQSGRRIDAHMGETISPETEEELLDYNLYPYVHLIKKGLLDAIMTEHARFPSVDPDYPASLSKKCIDIIRRQGFEGIAMTDALCMMGVVAKFGKKGSIGLAMAAGNDLTLPFHLDNKFSYEAQLECLREGVYTEEELDVAVSRVLAAQAKTLKEPRFAELSEEDLTTFSRITKECIYARVDEGLELPISRDGRHYFAILTESQIDIREREKVDVDQLNKGWYNPLAVADKIMELFPNSTIHAISEFPSARQNAELLSASLGYKDVVFITFSEAPAYTGSDRFTPRLIALMDAMQLTGRITTQLHFGSPFVLDELPHIPRRLIGCVSEGSVSVGLDVLAGVKKSNGKMTYKVNLK